MSMSTDWQFIGQHCPYNNRISPNMVVHQLAEVQHCSYTVIIYLVNINFSHIIIDLFNVSWLAGQLSSGNNRWNMLFGRSEMPAVNYQCQYEVMTVGSMVIMFDLLANILLQNYWLATHFETLAGQMYISQVTHFYNPEISKQSQAELGITWENRNCDPDWFLSYIAKFCKLNYVS